MCCVVDGAVDMEDAAGAVGLLASASRKTAPRSSPFWSASPPPAAASTMPASRTLRGAAAPAIMSNSCTGVDTHRTSRRRSSAARLLRPRAAILWAASAICCLRSVGSVILPGIFGVQQGGTAQEDDGQKVNPPALYAEQGEEKCAGCYQQGFAGVSCVCFHCVCCFGLSWCPVAVSPAGGAGLPRALVFV